MPASDDDTLRQTHCGTVWLVGERAYKFKRPVRLDFLDFSTVEARQAACARELELNRRLAPDVYLGLGSLSSPDAAAEPCVVMRRLPSSRRLATLLTSPGDVEWCLNGIARTVAAFHAGAARSAEIDRAGAAPALRERWRANLAEVTPYLGSHLDADVVRAIKELVDGFLTGREVLLDSRIADGRIVDGHGDLLAQDIFCLDDGPRVLDCLDFDDEFRHVDVLDDVACLAMDIERLADGPTADLWVRRYVELTDDHAPPSLIDHYVAYRAFMRAKIGCLMGAAGTQEPGGDGSVAAHAEIALRHLRRAEVRLVLVGGTPGTGKTTLAGALADRHGWVTINSDRIRKELASIDPVSSAANGYGQGIYTAAWDERTYSEMLRRAELLMARGESVVLDASWSAAAYREDAARAARRAGSRLVAIRCEAPAEVAASRIRGRIGVSDADPSVARRMSLLSAPWPGASAADTTRPLDDVVAGLAPVLGTEVPAEV